LLGITFRSMRYRLRKHSLEGDAPFADDDNGSRAEGEAEEGEE
jgi:hypothetical protein